MHTEVAKQFFQSSKGDKTTSKLNLNLSPEFKARKGNLSKNQVFLHDQWEILCKH